mgnify:CR=1 FL=1
MGSKTANGLIALGAILLLGALFCAAGATGQASDRSSILAAAAAIFSLGALMVAGGLYLKARSFPQPAASEQQGEPKRVRGGCDLCAGDAPVIHCKVHQLYLCPACLAEHYDFRSCAYVPSTRKASVRTKVMTKARGA